MTKETWTYIQNFPCDKNFKVKQTQQKGYFQHTKWLTGKEL